MKYKVRLGAFVSRLVQRTITVSASCEDEAREKAEEKFIELEMKLVNSGDVGRINLDDIEEIAP